MRSVTYASVVALAFSVVSAFPSGAIDNGSNRIETARSVDGGYPNNTNTNTLVKRHYHSEPARSVNTGYTCGTTFYSTDRIQKTVEKACKKINSKKLIKPKYPKIYSPKTSAAEFRNVKGNQYMFPIRKKGVYSRLKKAGRDRVVLNKECKLAGLVVQKKNRTWYTLGLGGKVRFSKCTKVYEKN